MHCEFVGGAVQLIAHRQKAHVVKRAKRRIAAWEEAVALAAAEIGETAMVEKSDDEPVTTFRDRRDGGRRLVQMLQHYRARPATVVLGLPRGGVVPAAEIAAALDLPLDVLISRKIGSPQNPEFAIGAVAEDGSPYLSEEGLALTGASKAYLDEEIARQREEIARRREWFRGGQPLVLPERATAILVDDGIATGATVIAAIGALRQLRVARIVLAVPVAPPDTVERLRRLVDEIVVLTTPVMFWAVGAFYENFTPVLDDEVRRILTRARRVPGERASGAREATPDPVARGGAETAAAQSDVGIPVSGMTLSGILNIPRAAKGIVLFAHGSGSGRFSPRNTRVAAALHDLGFATLLLDLLTEAEAADQRKVFDVGLLAERLHAAATWARKEHATTHLPIGYFGASTGAAAALIAAAFDPAIRAVVSRGGRPDLASTVLHSVKAPTLLIVGGDDHLVIRLNEEALAALRCEKQLQIVPGAGHLFEEPGTLDEVARLAGRWFERHLRADPAEQRETLPATPRETATRGRSAPGRRAPAAR
jgi:putative phosphoribosyl transferase